MPLSAPDGQDAPQDGASAPTTPALTPIGAGEAVRQIPALGAIVERIEAVERRRQRLDELLRGMDHIFAPTEKELVQERIEHCVRTRDLLAVELQNKNELYSNYILKLEDLLQQRKEYRAKFDEILMEEPDIAGAIVDNHSGLEEQLRRMNVTLTQTADLRQQ